MGATQGINAPMRYLIALATAGLIVAMLWPRLRHYAPMLRPPESKPGQPKPVSKGELIYLAILTTVVLSFTISTLLWVFSR
jgi:hypothetical protein